MHMGLRPRLGAWGCDRSPSLPSREAIGRLKEEPSCGCMGEPPARRLMAAMDQSVWYMVTPPQRRGLFTLITWRDTWRAGRRTRVGTWVWGRRGTLP